MATKYEVAVERAVKAEDAIGAALAEVNEHKAHAEKLEKELASAKTTSDHYYKSMQSGQAEIEQCHCLLDALDGVPRKSAPTGDYGHQVTYALMTRLAAWMARK